MISWKDIEQQIKKNLPQMNIKNVEIRNINPNFEQTTDLKTFFEDYYPEMEMDIMRAQIQKEQIELSEKFEGWVKSNVTAYENGFTQGKNETLERLF